MVDQIRVVGHPEVLSAAKEKVKKHQKAWDFIEEWLEVSMSPSVIYILNDEHYYLTQNTPSQEFLVWGTFYLGDTRDSVIAYESVKYLTSENATQGTSDFDLLKSAMEWLI